MAINFKKILAWLAILAIILVTFLLVRRYFSIEEELKLLSPNGQEMLQAGKTYQIRWQSRKITKVGILLVKGGDSQETKWIATDISAEKKRYDWQVFAWEKPGEDYRIAVLEYPWQEGKLRDYSDDFFSIAGPEFASCDELSVAAEWPYLPSDFPGQKRVFITQKTFTGDLGGLEGADRKCQEEADSKEFGGTWKAFLGDDTSLAYDRLDLEGIFVMAAPVGELPEGKTCRRLLAKDFEEFSKRLSSSLSLNETKFERGFLADLQRVWLGKINQESKEDCLFITTGYTAADMSRLYSFTTTCQNWRASQGTVPGYPPGSGQEMELAKCYNPQGVRIDAAGLAGLSSGLVRPEGQGETLTVSLGRSCNTAQKLLCFEQ
jgi:hypothetical protein